MTSPQPTTVVGEMPLRPLLEPQSIVVIGASDDPATMGSRPLRYLARAGFSGELYRINPRKADQPGFLASVEELEDGSVDLAIVLVRADRVVETLAACAGKGVKAAIIGTAGFAETGAEGSEIERSIAELASRTGMRILGPNCLGLVNHAAGTYATFASLDEDAIEGATGDSGLAMVSQSGALASYLVDILEDAGAPCRTWLSTGNELDVGAADCLEYLAGRTDLSAILLYLEGAKDVPRLRAALHTARAAGKVVAVIKAGSTPAGATAVASHTASIAGEDFLFDAAFRESGTVRLRDMSEVVTFAQLMAHGNPPRGPRLGVLTLSGGVGALMADECVEAGLELPGLPEKVAEHLRGLVPFATASNPLDPTGAVAADPALMTDFLDGIGSIEDLDSVVVFAGPALVEQRYGMGIIEALRGWTGADGRFVAVSGVPADYARRELAAIGVPLCADPVVAIRVLGRLVDVIGQAEMEFVAPEPIPANLPEILADQEVVSETAAKEIVAALGIRLPARKEVATAEEAGGLLSEHPGSTFVIKADAIGVAHKSEAGLVRLGIADEGLAITVYGELRENLDRVADGQGTIFVEEQISGVEVLVNVRLDKDFGPVLTVGTGGVYSEVDADVAVWLGLPTKASFSKGIERLRLWHRLSGYRGNPPADVDALYEVCSRLMGAIAGPEPGLREIELNPVAVLPRGEGATALDAVAWLAEREVPR